MSNIFDQPRKGTVKVSRFRPNFNYSGSFYPGYIYPIFAKKVIPGDTFYVASNPRLWFQPMMSPVLNNIKVDIRYFYVRNLLIWDNFDQYLTSQQRYGNAPSNIVHPYFAPFECPPLSGNTIRTAMLLDALYGCIPGKTYRRLNPLPARAYNLIFNEYYRDEFLTQGLGVPRTDGVQSNAMSQIIGRACYKKDYFTSCLPYPQVGDPVSLNGRVILDAETNQMQGLVDGQGNPAQNGAQLVTSPNTLQGNTNMQTIPEGGGALKSVNLDPNGTLAVNIDIRDLRKASAIQRYLEKSAVGGNRYAEYILTHFGVRTPDNSTFRPQYLGGGEQYINISPVEQNSQTDTTPQGTLAGRGRLDGLVGMNHAYFFTEHGWLLGMMVIRPEADYYGGLQRQFHAFEDVLDNYPVPELQNIGMMEVRNEELCVTGNDIDYGTFGYNEQYIDYKTYLNEVHGELRGSLKSWLVSRGYTTNAPALNASFVSVMDDAFNNNMAVNEYPPLLGLIHHDVIAKRPLQYHASYKLA